MSETVSAFFKRVEMNRLEAEKYVDNLLEYAIKLGRKPGTWYFYHNHIYGVALLAQKMAESLDGLDAERAYVIGLLHDVGKFDEQREQRFHGLCGYNLLKEKDEQAARIALTHTFFENMRPPHFEIERLFLGKQQDYDWVAEYLSKHPVDEYDRLIQLCDCLANCNGLVTQQERMEEFALRHGKPLPEYIVERTKKLKAYFDAKLGRDVYSLFTEISPDYMLKPGQDRK